MRFVLLFLLFLSSCISTRAGLQRVQVGFTKKEVFNEIGRPEKVRRIKGVDRWLYKFKLNSQKHTREIFFEEGRVLKIGPLTPYPNYYRKMEEAETIEEYEQNANFYRRQKEAGFRKINSLSEPKIAKKLKKK